jgi:hypothetical protein
MAHRRFVSRAPIVAVAALCASLGTGIQVAGAIDLSAVGPIPEMIAVTGPVPGTAAATPCGGPSTGRTATPARSARRLDAAGSSPRILASGSVAVAETWTKCSGSMFPLSIGASVEMNFPQAADRLRDAVPLPVAPTR